MEIHGKFWMNNEEKDHDLLKIEKKKNDQDPKREKEDHNLKVKRNGNS